MIQQSRFLARASGGFSLLEVLIAVVILAIGLLGIASTQILSLQQSGNANLRSQATIHAQNLADEVRANDGEMISAGEMERHQQRVRDAMGGEATITASRDGNSLTTTVTWTEQDPFADGGRSQEEFVLRSRMER